MTPATTQATLQRARFARKPYSLDEVLHNTDPSAPFEPIEIELHKELTEAEYDAFANTLLQDRDWLAGLGGHAEGRRRVVAVSAPGRTTVFVDPSGSAYGRYVGIGEETPELASNQAEAIGWLISPGCRLFRAASNSGTNWRGLAQPRSPPALALPSSE